MYYQNYDDYMRDVFYFNQMPNQNFNYPNMAYNVPNQNFQANNMGQSINNMYPSIYRIIQPVVSRVVTGNNYQYMSEDNLNSMVDTVFNIVESDVTSQTSENNEPNNNQTQRSNGTNSSQNATLTNSQNSNTTVRNSNQNSSNLLKDLIKILLIKEIVNRNNIRRFNNGMYGNQNFPGFYDQRYVF